MSIRRPERRTGKMRTFFMRHPILQRLLSSESCLNRPGLVLKAANETLSIRASCSSTVCPGIRSAYVLIRCQPRTPSDMMWTTETQSIILTRFPRRTPVHGFGVMKMGKDPFAKISRLWGQVIVSFKRWTFVSSGRWESVMEDLAGRLIGCGTL